MTTHHEPIHRNLDAIDSLAREVVDMNDARDYLATAGPLAVYTVGGRRYARLSVSEKIERKLLDAAPILARAAIDLIARLDAERFAHTNTAVKVKRVEALAELLERESGILRDRGDYPNESGMMAARIRIALNGGDQ